MLFFSRTKTLAILLMIAVVCLFAVPNFLPGNVVQELPSFARRHIVLGLDLQGGASRIASVTSKITPAAMPIHIHMGHPRNPTKLT
jgi:preprotein translocase subunit SecD